MNEESILTSIKKMLGIAKEVADFDTDLIIHINSVLMILRQIGIGPTEGFCISDETETWADFLGDDYETIKYAPVKTYIFLKVRQLFDPAMNGAVNESTSKLISELEYRIYAESNWTTIT